MQEIFFLRVSLLFPIYGRAALPPCVRITAAILAQDGVDRVWSLCSRTFESLNRCLFQTACSLDASFARRASVSGWEDPPARSTSFGYERTLPTSHLSVDIMSRLTM